MHKFLTTEKCPFKDKCDISYNCICGNYPQLDMIGIEACRPYIPLFITGKLSEDEQSYYMCEIKSNVKEKLANKLSMIDNLPQAEYASYVLGIPKIEKYEGHEKPDFIINHALIVVDKYWDGDINSIIHFVGYELPITDEDRNNFISELSNPKEDWSPIMDLEKEQLKIIEAPTHIIEYFREILNENNQVN